MGGIHIGYMLICAGALEALCLANWWKKQHEMLEHKVYVDMVGQATKPFTITMPLSLPPPTCCSRQFLAKFAQVNLLFHGLGAVVDEGVNDAADGEDAANNGTAAGQELNEWHVHLLLQHLLKGGIVGTIR